MKKKNSPIIIKRNEKIVARYKEMCEQHLKDEYILKQLSEEEFFLEKDTIWNIIKKGLARG